MALRADLRLPLIGQELESEPRYILYMHKVEHDDGRVQYPIAFIVYLPDNVPVNLKVHVLSEKEPPTARLKSELHVLVLSRPLKQRHVYLRCSTHGQSSPCVIRSR